MPDSVSHRGFCVWLQSGETRLPLGIPTLNTARDEVTTVVELEKQRVPVRMHIGYSVEWCKTEDASPVNARCEIFRPDKDGNLVRIANERMAADEAATQSRTSVGRLELPIQNRDARLSTGYGAGDAQEYEMDLDYFSSDDPGDTDLETGLPMRPFVTFIFQFKHAKAAETERTNTPRVKEGASRVTRATAPTAGPAASADSPGTPQRALPADIARESSSRSPAARLASQMPSPPTTPITQNNTLAITGKRSSNDPDLDQLLERKKRAKIRREQIEEENKNTERELEKLKKDLETAAKAEEELLANAERRSQELKVDSVPLNYLR
ncbi:Mg transporter [Mycena kentingensis (nom. inval.)]|nr:Mg transporter [Mycena kentingensis (nom. inval.)]